MGTSFSDACSWLLDDETLIHLVKTTPDGRCLDELQSSQKDRPLFINHAFVDIVLVVPQEVDDAIARRDEQRCPDAATLHRHLLTVEAPELLVSCTRRVSLCSCVSYSWK